MLHYLVPDEVPPGSLVADLAHYEPRTAHGSTLSPGVHATLLALPIAALPVRAQGRSPDPPAVEFPATSAGALGRAIVDAINDPDTVSITLFLTTSLAEEPTQSRAEMEAMLRGIRAQGGGGGARGGGAARRLSGVGFGGSGSGGPNLVRIFGVAKGARVGASADPASRRDIAALPGRGPRGAA